MTSRRSFLCLAGRAVVATAATSALCACGNLNWVWDEPPRRKLGARIDDGSPRVLNLAHRSGEHVEQVYKVAGTYRRDALREIEFMLRDREAEQVAVIDLRLLDVLAELQETFGPGRPIEVLSGFRSERTNAKLRQRNRNAARNSLHTRGQAVDIRIPGVDRREIFEAAAELKAGGVGLYRGESFVHVDVGPVRTWT
ncbi:MAG: DUF882 domain-containing protein [Alphaproteobacteria bacterium]|nr:DUF882 domain-containing protein [Alphaproteobacteria bacterium]